MQPKTFANCAGLAVQQDADAVTFAVKVSPGASRTAVVGVHDGALKVSLAAPAVEGAANAALGKFLARALGVPQKSVTLLRGHRSRRKTVCVAGVRAAEVQALVKEPCGGSPSPAVPERQ